MRALVDFHRRSCIETRLAHPLDALPNASDPMPEENDFQTVDLIWRFSSDNLRTTQFAKLSGEEYYNFCVFQDILNDDREPSEWFWDEAQKRTIGEGGEHDRRRRFVWESFWDLPVPVQQELRTLVGY